MKKATAFLAALLLAVSSLFVLAVPKAFAATKTWDGGGSDNNMTTGANWNGDSAPSAGDDLVFPAGISDRTITNDFSAATSFNSLTFSGAASGASNYAISGNSMTVVAGINNSMTGDADDVYQDIEIALILNGTQTFQAAVGDLRLTSTLNVSSSALTITPSADVNILFTGVVSGSGNITKSGAGTLYLSGANSSYSGAITASAGSLEAANNSALGATSGATTINSGADLLVGNCSDMTVAENITLTGDSSNTTTKAKLISGVTCAGGSFDATYGVAAANGDITLSGTITLGSDITLSPWAETTTLSGGLSGDFTINLTAGYGGKLVVNATPNGSKKSNGTYTASPVEYTLSDSQPTLTVLVAGTAIVTLDGTRGDITVGTGGILKGTGTASSVLVSDGGTIAPGHSPGCLTMSGLTLSGTFSVEIGGTTACSGYDQLKVNGAVTVTDGELSLSLYNDFKPKVGEKYVIISNDGADAVTGTLSNIAEGGTVTAGGATFKVSYVGGDGNDVELTVLVAPPATGFTLFKSNPLLTAGIIVLSAFGILMIARRSGKAFSRRKNIL